MHKSASTIVLLGLLAAGCGDGPVRATPCETREDCDAYELCVEGACALQDFTPGEEDADFDGIYDSWEGAADEVDTDGDGVPDYLDTDSDDDGILDEVEGAGATLTIAPIDSDADGVPDYRDTDSDDNGILDANEGEGDVDGDGDLDRIDDDDDGDFASDVAEIGDDAENPADFDGDGTPDYQDIDSDGDTIADSAEGVITDTDGDGVVDRYDDDSDGDGILDADEAGDADVTTTPIDTDGDMRPDFQDIDSDNDGLLDAREIELGTSPTSDDTDDDGVPDLVEVSACFDEDCVNDATDPESSPRTRGDFVFIEPFEQVQDPERDTLAFETDIQTADVYFLMDTTGSMGSAVTSLATNIATFIPRVRDVIPDVWVGVGDFKDYGDSYVYRNVHNLSGDTAAVVSAVNTLTSGGGSGIAPEALIPSLWSMVTGMFLPGSNGSSPTSCATGYFGFPCFREGSVPIVVAITDRATRNGPLDPDTGLPTYPVTGVSWSPTFEETIVELRNRNVRVIGIYNDNNLSYPGDADLQLIARVTRATDSGGNPFYSEWSTGMAISDNVLDQIGALASASSLDVSVEFVDDDTDDVDTFAAFVQHLEANTDGDTELGCEPRVATDVDGDGVADTFGNVRTQTTVCFDVVTKQNDTVEATTEPQLFRATIRIMGDNFTELDSREVIFLVPPVIDGGFG